MPIKVACAQIAPFKAEVARNLDKIAEVSLQAASEGVDLVVFPEAAVTGYFLEGGVLECSLTKQELVQGLGSRLTGLAHSLDICVGFYEEDEGQLYNAVAYLDFSAGGEGRVVHSYHKFFLPTYGVFDEERFVARGNDLGVFRSRLGEIGILICEDVWHSIMPTLTAMAGAQILLVPSASPGRGFGGDTIANLDRYQRLLKAIGEEHGVYCVNAQLCGFEGGKGFVGGSLIVDPFGEVVVESPISEEHLLLADLDLDLISISRSRSPLFSDLQGVWGDVARIVDDLG
jgi:N-carbamoylputrescine amidase